MGKKSELKQFGDLIYKRLGGFSCHDVAYIEFRSDTIKMMREFIRASNERKERQRMRKLKSITKKKPYIEYEEDETPAL